MNPSDKDGPKKRMNQARKVMAKEDRLQQMMKVPSPDPRAESPLFGGLYRMKSKDGFITYGDQDILKNLWLHESKQNWNYYPFKPYWLYKIKWWWILKIYNPFLKTRLMSDARVKHKILERLYYGYKEREFYNVHETYYELTQILFYVNVRDSDRVHNMLMALVGSEEVEVVDKEDQPQYFKHFFINKKGAKSFVDKSYLRDAKDSFRKSTTFWLDFISKPIMAVIALFAAIVGFWQYRNNKSIEEKYNKVLQEVREARRDLFLLDRRKIDQPQKREKK